jgi:hypothetical protein
MEGRVMNAGVTWTAITRHHKAAVIAAEPPIRGDGDRGSQRTHRRSRGEIHHIHRP